MSEKNITLISKDYAESIFVTGPQVDQIISEHGEFITGPQLQTELSKKQDYVGFSLITDEHIQLDLKGLTQVGGSLSNAFDGPVEFRSPIYLTEDDADGTCSIKHRIWPMGVGIEIETKSNDTGESAVIEMGAEAGAYIILKINNRTCELYEDDLRKLREILDAHS